MTLIRTSPSGPNVEVDAPVDLAPNSILGNPTLVPAPGVDIPLGPDTVLGRVAGNIVAAQLVTAQIALNQITNAVLAQGAALTVKANPTGALADFQDVPATADDTLFRRVAGVLDFGPLTPGMLPPATIPLSSIETIAANTVVANATAGAASPTAVAVPTNTVLGRVAGNIVAAQIVTSQIGASQVTNAELAPMDAVTVKVNATAAPANPQDLTVGMNTVVGRVGGNIIAAQIVTAQIALNQADNTILAKMAANTVKVNASAILADPQDLALGTNTVLGRVAGNIVAAQLVTAQVALNQVTNALLAQMAALTVKANATAALADPQDVSASADDTLFRRTGSTLNFGPLTAGMIPAAIIPLSAIESLAANTVVANATGAPASPTAVPLGFNTVLGRVAGNIVAAQLVTAQIALNQVTNAVLAQMAANTVKVNATAALADPQDLAVGTNTVVGRVAGNIVAAQLVTAQIALNQVTNAVLAQMVANTVKVNATAALADPQDLAVGTNTVLGRVAGNIVAAALVDAQISATAAIALSKLATQAANTVVANATTGTASPTAFAIGTNTVLGRVAGNIVAAQLVTAQVGANQITNALLAQIASPRLRGRTTAATGNVEDLTLTNSSTITWNTATGGTISLERAALTGAITAAANSNTTAFGAAAAKSVLVNAANASAVPAFLAATASGQYLRSNVDFTALELALLPNSSAFAAGTWWGNNNDTAAAAVANSWSRTVGPNLRYSAGTANGSASVLTISTSLANQSFATATTVILALPTTDTSGNPIVAGDRIVVVFRIQTGGGAGINTAPAGWTFITSMDESKDLIRFYERVLDGTEGPTATFTLLTSRPTNARLEVIRGSNPTVAAEASAVVALNFGSSGIDPANFAPSFASTAIETLFITFATISTPSVQPCITGYPASTTNQVEVDFNVGGYTLGRCQRNLSAASWDPSAWTWTTALVDSARSVTLAFEPANTGVLDMAQMAANTVKGNPTAALASPSDIAIGTNTVLGRVAGNIVAAALVAEQLAATASSRAVSFLIGPIALTATGAAADDVIVFNASAFRAFRIISMIPIVTVGQVAGTLVARNATGGGGAAVSNTFDASVASNAPLITANLGLTQTIAASGTLVVRRNNGNIQGEVFFECMPL